MFNHTDRKSKARFMDELSREGVTPVTAKLAERNTLDYMLADGTRRIRYHFTDIVTFHPNGAITVYTGGWNTLTTRARLNAFLPTAYRVHTDRGVIHLRHPKGVTPFQTRIEIGPRGKIAADSTAADHDADRKRIDRFMRHVRKTGLPGVEDSKGDPWVFAADQITPDVMWDWVDNLYFTRRMFTLALDWAGLSPMGIGLSLHMADRDGRIDRTDLRRIRRYIRHCVGYAT